MATQAVIAHLCESLEWLKPWMPDSVTHIHMYHKGVAQLPRIDGGSVQRLPNVGRESHTYLHHIVQHYDTAPDDEVVLFLQGDVSDHVPQFNQKAYLSHLVEEARRSGLSASAAACYSFGPTATGEFVPMHEWRLTRCKGQALTPSAHGPFGAWIRHHAGQTPSQYIQFPWFAGAIFATTWKRIRRVPKQTWSGLLREFEDSGINPEAGHFMERAWYYMLSSIKPRPSDCSGAADA